MPDDNIASSEGTGEDPEDVFAVMGNDTRASILQTLGKTPHEEVPFSELRSRVDPEMDSGQFNYHLSKLEGQFIDRTDDGYTLRTEGLSLYRTIRAGTFNRRASIEPFDAGFDCYFCGSPVQAMYEDGTFDIKCLDCDHQYVQTTSPPSAVETNDPEELLDRISRYNRHTMQTYADGVCPTCVSRVDMEFRAGEDVWTEGSERLDLFVVSTCHHCGSQHFMSLGFALLDHPAVVAFSHEQGLNLTERPHWELEFAMTDDWVTIHSRDPWDVTLRVPGDDEDLELRVNEELTVTETRRV